MLCLSTAFHTVSHVIPATKLARADIGFIFGNRSITAELALEAARLYRAGYFSSIVVTGGVAMDDGRTEADTIASRLEILGVPERAILLETLSTNTGENVMFSRPLIEQKFGAIDSVIGLGHFKGGARFLMTLARRSPEWHAMFVPVYPEGVTPVNWRENPEMLDLVEEESAKTLPYLDRGFISPVDLEAIDRETERRNAGRFASADPVPCPPARIPAFAPAFR